MNTIDISISLWVVVISTILRLLAGRHYWYVVKRALQESGVRNGLVKLRKQLLICSAILLFIDIAGLTIILARFVSDDFFLIYTNFLAVINSIGFYIDSRLKKDIYSGQYTDKQKEIHAKIEEMEIAINKKGGVK